MKKLGMSFTVLFIILSMMLANVISASASVAVNDTFDSGTYATNGYYSMSSATCGAEIINQSLRITATNNNAASGFISKSFTGVNSGTLVLEFDYNSTLNMPSTNAAADWIQLLNGTTTKVKVNVTGSSADKVQVGNTTLYAIGNSSTQIFTENKSYKYKFLMNIGIGTIEVQRDGTSLYTSPAGAFTAGSTLDKFQFGLYASGAGTIDYDNVKVYTVGNEASPLVNDTFVSGTAFSNNYIPTQGLCVEPGTLIFYNYAKASKAISAEKRFTPVTSGKLVLEFDVLANNLSSSGVRMYPGYTNAGLITFYDGSTIKLDLRATADTAVGLKYYNGSGTLVGSVGSSSTVGYWGVGSPASTSTTPTTMKIILDLTAGTFDVYNKNGGTTFTKTNSTALNIPGTGQIDRIRFTDTATTVIKNTKFSNIKMYTLGTNDIASPIIVNNNGSDLTNAFATGNVVRAAVPVFNSTASQKDLTIVLALYDSSNKLKNITYTSTQTIAASETAKLFDLKYTLPAVATGDYIKAFAWDTIDTVKPLAASTTSVTKQ